MNAIRPVSRRSRQALTAALVLLLVLISVGHGDQVSDLRLAAGAYEQDITRWEITHFMDKWGRRLGDVVLPGTPNADDRRAAVDEFFALRADLAQARADVNQALAAPADAPQTATDAQASVDAFLQRRAELQAVVEETLEAAITQVVRDMGVIDSLGPIQWPPVDFTFEERALVLVRSPSDRIARLDDLLLDPGVSVLDQVGIEQNVESLDDNTAALVVRIGGVATYPAQVSPNRSLHGTLELAAHEWLHHWLIFRPLGRSWFAGGELQSVNETVANIFGQEVGDRTLELLTGEVVDRPAWVPPTVHQRDEPPADVFDFRREMRETRLALDVLLDDARADDAEAYLEERRLAFVANGYHIRKLNNAWFAFNGTYADAPGSVSPLEGQLRAILADASDLAAFLDRIAGVNQPGQIETLALAAGWQPIDTATGLPSASAPRAAP
jgi:hypothetical protein